MQRSYARGVERLAKNNNEGNNQNQIRIKIENPSEEQKDNNNNRNVRNNSNHRNRNIYSGSHVWARTLRPNLPRTPTTTPP